MVSGLATALQERHPNVANVAHRVAAIYTDRRHDPIAIQELRRPSGETDTTRIVERTVINNGFEVKVLEAGALSSPDLLISRGSGNASSDDWRALMKLLAPYFHILVYDHPGFGTALPDGQKCTIEYLADFLFGMVKTLELKEQFFVIGHSAGAFAASMFAAQNPGRIAGMVGVNSDNPNAQKHWGPLVSLGISVPKVSYGSVHKSIQHERLFFWGYRKAVRGSEPEEGQTHKQQADAVKKYIGSLPFTFFELISDHRKHSKIYADLLASVRQSVPIIRIVHGERDWLIRAEYAKQTASLLGVEVDFMENCGHSPQITDPHGLLEHILAAFPHSQQTETPPPVFEHRNTFLSRIRRSYKREPSLAPAA